MNPSAATHTADGPAVAPTAPAPAPALRAALVCLALSTLLPSLALSSANVALPSFAQVFAAAFQDVQWIVLSYLLALTTLVVGAGRLGDRLGRRRLLLAGIALFTAASALCGVAPTLGLLIAARAAQGLGAAVMMALTLAVVGDTVPKARIGSAMGLLGTMSATGIALGPALGGVLIAAFGWPAIFFLNLPLGLAAFGLAWRSLPADRPQPERSAFDALGTVLLALTLAAYALAMTLGRGSFGALNLALLAAALVGTGLFVAVETRVPAPVVPLAMLRHQGLTAGLVLNLLVMTVAMATLVVGPFYLAQALGLDAARVGLVMSVGPLVAALSGVPAGRLVDRFGAAPMSVAGLVGMAAGTAGLAALPASLGIAGYVAPLAVMTSGYALFQAANTTAVMKEIRAEQRGVTAGLLNLSRSLGTVTGAAAMGAVFAAATATSDITAAAPTAVAGGTHVTFAVGAGLLVIALALAAASRARAARP